MASPAAIGAGVGGGAVAVAGTSYAAYTQLRPYDNFLDYAQRNGKVYIGGGEARNIKSAIKSSSDVSSDGYKKDLKDNWTTIKGDDASASQEGDIDGAGKTGDTDEAKLNKLATEVNTWCESKKEKTPTKTGDSIDWLKVGQDANWVLFEKVCLEKS
ncbi:hypothetical protein [Candidatus Mycoplasma haematohominis]|uniref:hypothetical protein n=1 Tax=Candidatus Mycoplasma haematohominis TaxID=1494318 RepID=UPI001C0A6EB0|nr:hypothetical protein [Candidatus Mycoplasma haemohominis]